MTFDAVPTSFEVSVIDIEAVTIVSVRGELDVATAPALAASIDAVLSGNQPPALIVDLTEVLFLASMGMTVLIETSRRVSEAAMFAVVADGPSTARPLTMMGLDKIFPIYPDLDAAVAALAR